MAVYLALVKEKDLLKDSMVACCRDLRQKVLINDFLSVFPEATKIGENYKSAENLSIDLKKKNIFPTFTCRPIDGAIVGCTEANVLVYIDDCVKTTKSKES